MAKNFYRPSDDVRLTNFSKWKRDPLGDLINDPNSRIDLSFQGKCRLHFQKNPKSGIASIEYRGKSKQINLRSDKIEEIWVEFGEEGLEDYEISISLHSLVNADDEFVELWLLGVDFSDIQPWQALSFPLSPASDFRFGSLGSFIFPHNDAVIGKSIRNSGAWAEKDISIFKEIIKPGDTVFDVGANIGHHTVFFANSVGESGRVFAFEPQTEIFRYASANLALNGCRNATLLQGCLGEEDGDAYMAPVSYETGDNFGALSVASLATPSGGELVPVWSLDSLISSGKIKIDRLDFMKIDVQAFELFVLRGAIETIKNFRPTIFLEISPYYMKRKGYDYRLIYKSLFDLSYSVKHLSSDFDVVDGIREWRNESYEEWDILCIP
ncbi:MAG: FkbM family methyltransferase [Erythrobacter sp.]